MDNGKPIRESRDIDIPLVSPPLLSPCRLGRADRERVPRLSAGRRLRPDHPVEFSAADAGLEDRAGARRRQHGGAEAGRIHAAHRARLRRDLPRGRPAAGVVNIVTGEGDTGARARRASGRRQDRLHRLDRGRPHHPQGDRRHGQEAVAGARRQVALHRLRRRRSRQRGRGRRRRDLVQPGPGLLRRLAPDRAGRRRRKAATPSSARAWRRCASAIRSTSRPTSARSSRPCSSSASPRWSSKGRAEGADVFQPSMLAAGHGHVLRADADDRRRAGLDRRRGGDFRAGAGLHDVPHAGRGAGARQQHALRPRRLGLVGEHQRHPRRRGAGEGRRRLGQLHQPLRRRRRLRRLSRERLRARRRPRGPLRISDDRRRQNEGQGGCQGLAHRRAFPNGAMPRLPTLSTARQSSISAASRRGRIPATAMPS